MTNKIVLRDIDEFLTGYKPAYSPLKPLFMGNAQQYTQEVGQVTFKRAEAMGDLDNEFFGPKQTEIKQILSKETSKVFKKYFLGSQYIQSTLQDTRGYEDVVAQVLDRHNIQDDNLFLTGGGTSDATVINNGLYFSNDPNYQKNSTATIANLNEFYENMISVVQDADDVEGQKLVLLYGEDTIALYNSLFSATSVSFAKTIRDALAGVSFAKMPTAIQPSGAEGYLVANLDQVKLHHVGLPKVDDQGINSEKKYAWTNFLMGSSMLEVLTPKGMVRQGLTIS